MRDNLLRVSLSFTYPINFVNSTEDRFTEKTKTVPILFRLIGTIRRSREIHTGPKEKTPRISILGVFPGGATRSQLGNTALQFFAFPVALVLPLFLYTDKGSSHNESYESFLLEAPPRFELGNKGFADLCLTTWLWRHI